MRPGAKYYWWELRGVPLRLELGPRDLDAGKVMAVTRTGQKSSIELATITEGINPRVWRDHGCDPGPCRRSHKIASLCSRIH